MHLWKAPCLMLTAALTVCGRADVCPTHHAACCAAAPQVSAFPCALPWAVRCSSECDVRLQLTTSRYTLGPCLDDAENYSHAAAIGVVCGVLGFILLLILIWALWYKGCFSRRGVRTVTA